MRIPERFFPEIVRKLLDAKLIKRAHVPRIESALREMKGDIIDALLTLGVPKEKLFPLISEVVDKPCFDLKSLTIKDIRELNEEMPAATVERYGCLVVATHQDYGYIVCSLSDDPMLRETLSRIYPKVTFAYCSTSELERAVRTLLELKQQELEEQLLQAQMMIAETERESIDIVKPIDTRKELDIELNLELPRELPVMPLKSEREETVGVELKGRKVDPLDELIDIDLEVTTRLSDKLRSGFIVIGSPGANQPELIDAFIEAGCSAIKVHLNMRHPASDIIFGRAQEEIPKMAELLRKARERGISIGIVPFNRWDYKMRKELKYLLYESDIKFDFYDLFLEVFPIELLRSKGVEKILAVKGDDKPAKVKSIWNKFKASGLVAVELAVVPERMYGEYITLGHIAEHILPFTKELSSIPLLLPTQMYVYPDDLQMLADMGFRGVVIGTVVTSLDPDKAYKVASSFVKVAETVHIRKD